MLLKHFPPQILSYTCRELILFNAVLPKEFYDIPHLQFSSFLFLSLCYSFFFFPFSKEKKRRNRKNRSRRKLASCKLIMKKGKDLFFLVFFSLSFYFQEIVKSAFYIKSYEKKLELWVYFILVPNAEGVLFPAPDSYSVLPTGANGSLPLH